MEKEQNNDRLKHKLEVQSSLNALYDEKYGGGLDQLEVYPYSLKSYSIALKVNWHREEIPAELVERYTGDKEYDSTQDTGVAGWLKESEKAKEEIIKIFEKLRNPRKD